MSPPSIASWRALAASRHVPGMTCPRVTSGAVASLRLEFAVTLNSPLCPSPLRGRMDGGGPRWRGTRCFAPLPHPWPLLLSLSKGGEGDSRHCHRVPAQLARGVGAIESTALQLRLASKLATLRILSPFRGEGVEYCDSVTAELSQKTWEKTLVRPTPRRSISFHTASGNLAGLWRNAASDIAMPFNGEQPSRRLAKLTVSPQ